MSKKTRKVSGKKRSIQLWKWLKVVFEEIEDLRKEIEEMKKDLDYVKDSIEYLKQNTTTTCCGCGYIDWFWGNRNSTGE